MYLDILKKKYDFIKISGKGPYNVQLYSFKKSDTRKSRLMMEVLANAMVPIILQYRSVSVSNEYAVYLKLP